MSGRTDTKEMGKFDDLKKCNKNW